MDVEINSKLNNFSSEHDMVEYLLDCFPFIKESVNTERDYVTTKTEFSMIQRKEISKKGDIYRRFRKKVYDNIEDISTPRLYEFMCPHCESMNIIFLHNTSERVCSNCNIVEIVNTDDDIGFKEEQDIDKTIVYSYKRENHFNEWMCQFQAKESTTVSHEVIDNIKFELKKQKISHRDDITHTKIKEILKKIGYSKYYEHTPYITTMVNGIKPPTMVQELEDRLRIMFYQIQAPFDKHCPKDRINFLSYSYVLYKFCELLGEDEYLPCFPLLKSKEKLYKHDQIWKKITTDLRWQFIPTI